MDESSHLPSNGPRKMSFKPKVPQRRIAKVPEAKIIKPTVESENSEWHRLVKESSGQRAPKADRKVAPVHVAFGYVNPSASSKAFGIHKRRAPPIEGKFEDNAVERAEKEYDEPWDYYSYYPVALPLRRPYSGDPELLDKQEFEASENLDDVESCINPAAELGLTDETDGEQMLLFQLPKSLPLGKKSASSSGDEVADSIKHSEGGVSSNECDDLPSGLMGKLLVYKSGLVKMKLGDHIFDVSPGLSPSFAQDVAVINPVEKHCCMIGELNKRAVVAPDVDYLLNSMTLD